MGYKQQKSTDRFVSQNPPIKKIFLKVTEYCIFSYFVLYISKYVLSISKNLTFKERIQQKSESLQFSLIHIYNSKKN